MRTGQVVRLKPSSIGALVTSVALLSVVGIGLFAYGRSGPLADASRLLSSTTVVTPDDPRLVFSHYAGQLSRNADYARIIRPIDTADQGDGSGQHNLAPGARMSFTISQDAAGTVVIQLEFDGMMTLRGLHNAAGVVLVDGEVATSYDFPADDDMIPIGNLSVDVPVPAGQHVVSLVFPYGASVRMKGVRVPSAARVTAGPPAPKFRGVLIGDSRLSGAGASTVAGTVGFQIAHRLNAEVINLSNGGRQLAPADFAIAGDLAPDLVYTLYDFNNFYPNKFTLADFGDLYATGLQNFLSASAAAGKRKGRLVVITSFPTSSDAGSSPAGLYVANRPTLEQFRSEERRQVERIGNPRITVVEGRGRGMPSIDDGNSRDGVHFTDAGQITQAIALAASL